MQHKSSQNLSRPHVAVLLFISTLITAVLADLPEAKIVASGFGSKSVVTSLTVISLGVEDTQPIAAETQASIAAKTNALLTYLNGTIPPGVIRDLQTTGISLRPQDNYSNSPPSVTGYSGSNTVKFETNVAAAGSILDGSAQNGASKIEPVRFKATEKVLQDARSDAVEAAVKKARNDAISASRAAYIVIGKVIEIHFSGAYPPVASYRCAIPEPEPMSNVDTKVLPQIQAVTARVTVTFSAHESRRMQQI